MIDDEQKEVVLTDAERLAELQDELINEDAVEEEQENHFRTKSVLPPKERSTTGL